MSRKTFILALTMLAAPLVRAQSPSERALLGFANQSRAQYGLPPLRWDASLAVAARMHLQRMVAEGSVEHQYSGEGDLATRATQAGVRFSSAGENLGARALTPAQIHQGWMNSPHHRDNLLDPGFNTAGIAVVEIHGLLYAVEDLARSVPQLSRDQIESRVGQFLLRRGIAAAPSDVDARRICQNPHSDVGSASTVVQWDGPDPTDPPPVLLQEISKGRYAMAAVGVCAGQQPGNRAFTTWHVAVLLY